jgi:NitT/TauT family transport system permease protein
MSEQAVAAGRARGSGVRRGRHLAEMGVSVLLLLASLAGWELLSATGFFNRVIIPAPSAIARDFVVLVSSSFFPAHLGATMVELTAGFLIGAGAALAAGIALATLPVTKRILYPYVVAFQNLPKIVLAPIFVTWFGFGLESKIAMAVAICFFPTFINTMVGLESVDDDARKLMRSLQATRWQTFRKLAFPHALPLIFAGLKTSLTFAIIGAIVGEFVGARLGLGYLITAYNFQLKTTFVFALIIIVSVVGLLLYLGLSWLDRKIVFWGEGDAGDL